MPQRDTRGKPRWKKVVGAIVVLIIVVVVLRVVFGGSDSQHGQPGHADKDKDKSVPVTVVPVAQKDVPLYLTATGTVQAQKTVDVRPQVGGRLLKLEFKEGEQVEAGDVLAQIDPRTYRADYQQARARMHSDQAQLATARADLKRSRKLSDKNYISQQALKTQANKVDQLKATVEADRATMKDAKIKLDYTKIKAPISGLAGIRQVDPGNVLGTSDSIVTLTHVHPINVMFTLPAKNLTQVRNGQARHPLPVAAINRTSDKVLADDGHLKVIDNHIDPDTGTFTLKSRFPNKDSELWPGEFVNVRLKVSSAQNALVIPVQAVQRGSDGDYVYLLQDDDTVAVQPITVAGQADDTHVLVADGLDAGDRVVSAGQFRLKDGSEVKPLKPGEMPASGGSAPDVAASAAGVDPAAATSR